MERRECIDELPFKLQINYAFWNLSHLLQHCRSFYIEQIWMLSLRFCLISHSAQQLWCMCNRIQHSSLDCSVTMSSNLCDQTRMVGMVVIYFSRSRIHFGSLSWYYISSEARGFWIVDFCFPRFSLDAEDSSPILVELYDKRSVIIAIASAVENLSTIELVLTTCDVDTDASSMWGTFANRYDAASKLFFGVLMFCHLSILCCFSISAWNKRLCFI